MCYQLSVGFPYSGILQKSLSRTETCYCTKCLSNLKHYYSSYMCTFNVCSFNKNIKQSVYCTTL